MSADSVRVETEERRRWWEFGRLEEFEEDIEEWREWELPSLNESNRVDSINIYKKKNDLSKSVCI